jgi:hypothetical protein
MSTTPSTVTGRLALSLAHLRLCERDLAKAHDDVIEASAGLSGARLGRASQLVALIDDAIAFAERMAFVVEADIRYEETQR